MLQQKNIEYNLQKIHRAGSNPALATLKKLKQIMGEIEKDFCDFCKQNKPVERTYLKPSKYVKKKNNALNNKLYNQGDYFAIIRSCFDCGIPKV